ncbi:hypothetical protein [Opitutus sp. GAS368]|uniref:hypothetical protein n=1 Tax=Opitutus sp. GAS368 TaxID=1882749 RepID=UPI00087D190F|nr:hypothetical protein [Opitutus sp. GAS368]SDR69334.1 hypothetical protein SAMN05444173_0444 [Opitutus sp. GAS368]
MRPLLLAVCLVSAALLAACSSTPDSRIARSQAAFNQYPSAVQQKIRAGEVDVGFTPEMVLLALGEPARQFTHQSETGTAEIWIYHDNGPRFSFGIGVGSFGRHSATSVGVSSSTGGYDPEEKMRVEFRDGKVTAIEYVKR